MSFWPRTKWYTARRDYICLFCGKKIKKGKKYWRVVDAEEDEDTYFQKGAYCEPGCAEQMAWRKSCPV